MGADELLLGIGVGVLTDSMKDERGPGVSTVGLRPVYGSGAVTYDRQIGVKKLEFTHYSQLVYRHQGVQFPRVLHRCHW